MLSAALSMIVLNTYVDRPRDHIVELLELLKVMASSQWASERGGRKVEESQYKAVQTDLQIWPIYGRLSRLATLTWTSTTHPTRS